MSHPRSRHLSPCSLSLPANALPVVAPSAPVSAPTVPSLAHHASAVCPCTRQLLIGGPTSSQGLGSFPQADGTVLVRYFYGGGVQEYIFTPPTMR